MQWKRLLFFKIQRGLLVKLTFPFGDNYRCETVSDYIYRSTSHIHQFINSEYGGYDEDRQTKLVRRGDKDNQGSSRYGRHTLACNHECKTNEQLLTEGKTHTCRLRDEN